MADSPTTIDASGKFSGGEEQPAREEGGGGEPEKDAGGGLTDAKREVLERCLHALKHANNDSHTLAALLLITRLCPACQLDKPTLRCIFEAVGLHFPARLLVTAMKGTGDPSLPLHELLSLGTALLSALSTDPDMASQPQLLATIPLLLEILACNPTNQKQTGAQNGETEQIPESMSDEAKLDREPETSEQKAEPEDEDNGETHPKSPLVKLDEAMAADCFQILTAVCTQPRGPDHLLNRGAVPALCQALQQNQTLSQKMGLPLLICLLSGKSKDKAWRRHSPELLTLLVKMSKDFCKSTDQTSLDMCSLLVHILPPGSITVDREVLKDVVSRVWGALRPMVQAKLTQQQIGPVLVLSACLLDLYGWELAGPPKFCCLLVNRACVEVRMGLEEPPGTYLSQELQNTLTGCYRIMEAAIEQACSPAIISPASPVQSSVFSLSLQQSRQVLGVMEEAFSALMYYLQQVDQSRYGEPFLFATFRCLCTWLAEETSCLKEEVTALLPILIGYSRSHLVAESSQHGLSAWLGKMAVADESGTWTGEEALRYLLPALCHLSAEEGPRKGKSGASSVRYPSMETACSALLNFSVTEPERVRKDQCFKTLEKHLSEALPVLVNKSSLLVLAANYCTLGLMIGRLKEAPTGSAEGSQRRFFSTALRFLHSALNSELSPGPVKLSPGWQDSWDEVAELWRLSLQALGGCVCSQPWITALIREEGWLRNTLGMLGRCSALPDQHTQKALEEALCALADQCPLSKHDIGDAMNRDEKGVLSRMSNLKKAIGVK
ncbi:neurochondrin isoform X2 [Syngnathoides biaculeatus]|uniref:neurochondrin isoform X2 n=1 Tax=Syngnathoides biaculeatus TaxID=300417 RepID=UPI002ADDB89E|nr:neurochondrin isoform X2 [Syngnathoides biaculeatus]